MNTMIVDDVSSVSESLKFYLEEVLKINVQASFSNGKDLLKYPKTPESDIVLMDYNMPGVDDITITREYLFKYP